MIGRHWLILDRESRLASEVPYGSPGLIGEQPEIPPGGLFEVGSSLQPDAKRPLMYHRSDGQWREQSLVIVIAPANHNSRTQHIFIQDGIWEVRAIADTACFVLQYHSHAALDGEGSMQGSFQCLIVGKDKGLANANIVDAKILPMKLRLPNSSASR